MSVKKLANGRWQARERLGGRDSQRVSRTFDLKRDADQWVAKMRRQRQLGQPLHEEITLGEFAELWWEFHAIPNLAESTRQAYKNTWGRHIHPRLGGRNLRELTPAVLTRFRADLERAGVGAATVRKALAIVQSILRFAVVEGRLDFNPVDVVRKPRYQREREPHIFAPLDVEQLRADLGPLSATLLSVLAYAGPRPEEALRLRWADVGTEALHFIDTKRHRERWTPILPPLASDLRAWRLVSGRPEPSAPLFPAHDDGHWQADDWRNWRRRTWRSVAPEGSRPRDMRSSYVTVQVYSGQPLTTVAKWAGTSVEMIDRHYSGIIENFSGEIVPAATQIAQAREAVWRARGHSGATGDGTG